MLSYCCLFPVPLPPTLEYFSTSRQEPTTNFSSSLNFLVITMLSSGSFLLTHNLSFPCYYTSRYKLPPAASTRLTQPPLNPLITSILHLNLPFLLSNAQGQRSSLSLPRCVTSALPTFPSTPPSPPNTPFSTSSPPSTSGPQPPTDTSFSTSPLHLPSSATTRHPIFHLLPSTKRTYFIPYEQRTSIIESEPKHTLWTAMP